MTKVVLEQVNSANVKVNNSSDNERIFDIVQSMEVRSNNIMNISDGIVKQDGIVKANYQRWSESSMSIQFQTNDSIEMCSIVNATNEFIFNCEEAVANDEFKFE